MITMTQDASDPNKIVVTATVTMFIEKILIKTLDEEIENRIRIQAIKDLKSNPEVKKVIAEAATKMLLVKLGVEEKPEVAVVQQEKKDEPTAG